MQYVFLELPKYTAGWHPTDLVDKWAFFFRDAENLEVIPKGCAGLICHPKQFWCKYSNPGQG